MARQKREFTEEEIDTIKTLYNEGKSILEIANQLHTTNRIISTVIKNAGLKREAKPTKAAIQRKRDAINKAMSELLKELTHCRTMQYNTTGVEQAQWKAKREEINKQIRALHKEGLETYIDIEAENKLIEMSNMKGASVTDVLKQLEIAEARQLASKII